MVRIFVAFYLSAIPSSLIVIPFVLLQGDMYRPVILDLAYLEYTLKVLELFQEKL